MKFIKLTNLYKTGIPSYEFFINPAYIIHINQFTTGDGGGSEIYLIESESFEVVESIGKILQLIKETEDI
jgi:hypothetical protein